MDILAKLYHEWHAPLEKPRESEHEVWGRNEDLWIEAGKSLDPELLEELQESVMHLMDQEACREFEEGFRLGVQLMLEARTLPGESEAIR